MIETFCALFIAGLIDAHRAKYDIPSQFVPVAFSRIGVVAWGRSSG